MKEYHVYYSNSNVRKFEAENIDSLRYYLCCENRDLEYIETIAWETGDPTYEPSVTLWEEDWETGEQRHRGITPGCFWTDWE